MAIKFITGNKKKFAEARQLLAPVEIEQVGMDLEEIQEINSRKIIEHKLREAQKHRAGEFFVEDSALYLECFDYRLPGPLVKWFNDTIGTDGLAHLAARMGKAGARAETVVGYADAQGSITYFKGAIEGKIVSPQGDYKFGYDPIFLPAGHKKTLSMLKSEGNFSFSPRGIAMGKFKDFLESGK